MRKGGRALAARGSALDLDLESAAVVHLSDARDAHALALRPLEPARHRGFEHTVSTLAAEASTGDDVDGAPPGSTAAGQLLEEPSLGLLHRAAVQVHLVDLGAFPPVAPAVEVRIEPTPAITIPRCHVSYIGQDGPRICPRQAESPPVSPADPS